MSNLRLDARAVFETTVSKLLQKPESVAKAKPLFSFFHQYESHYGELAQVVKLESRMREAFAEDTSMKLFSQRFAQDAFDPTAVRPLISPATQTRPKALASVEGPRKLPRGESPLAGAAGRRLKQNRQPFDNTPHAGLGIPFAAPPPLPRDINFLLSIIPPASSYNAMHFKADEIVRILGETPLPKSVSHIPSPPVRGGPTSHGFGQPVQYSGMR